MPHQNEPYAKEIEWGTAIKLYEFETTVGQSNVLRKDGLLYALERLMPEIPLPVRIHECREGYGGKEASYDTPIAGLVVRLIDGKGDNLEPSFPLVPSAPPFAMRVAEELNQVSPPAVPSSSSLVPPSPAEPIWMLIVDEGVRERLFVATA